MNLRQLHSEIGRMLDERPDLAEARVRFVSANSSSDQYYPAEEVRTVCAARLMDDENGYSPYVHPLEADETPVISAWTEMKH